MQGRINLEKQNWHSVWSLSRKRSTLEGSNNSFKAKKANKNQAEVYKVQNTRNKTNFLHKYLELQWGPV